MRVFDIGNTARVGFFCLAADADAAKRIALAAGHAKRIENLRATDVTELLGDDCGLGALKAGARSGQLVKMMHSYTMAEALAHARKPAPVWRLLEDVRAENNAAIRQQAR